MPLDKGNFPRARAPNGRAPIMHAWKPPLATLAGSARYARGLPTGSIPTLVRTNPGRGRPRRPLAGAALRPRAHRGIAPATLGFSRLVGGAARLRPALPRRVAPALPAAGLRLIVVRSFFICLFP